MKNPKVKAESIKGNINFIKNSVSPLYEDIIRVLIEQVRTKTFIIEERNQIIRDLRCENALLKEKLLLK